MVISQLHQPEFISMILSLTMCILYTLMKLYVKNKYLKLEGEMTVSVDFEKYEADAAWDGIKGYVTNTTLKAGEVIDRYGDLWYIERAFRFKKFDLAVWPIYHFLRRLHYQDKTGNTWRGFNLWQLCAYAFDGESDKSQSCS